MLEWLAANAATIIVCAVSVSYTHLDVYKRQVPGTVGVGDSQKTSSPWSSRVSRR